MAINDCWWFLDVLFAPETEQQRVERLKRERREKIGCVLAAIIGLIVVFGILFLAVAGAWAIFTEVQYESEDSLALVSAGSALRGVSIWDTTSR